MTAPAFHVGTAKADITPPLTVPYLGYVPRHALFEGVHDPLHARALAVDDGGAPVVLLSVDAIGFSNAILGPQRHFTGEVRQRIAERTGVPPGRIVLAATHAHSTPETIHLRRLLDTPAAAPWLETLMDQLASAAQMAVARRQPMTLKVGAGAVRGLAANRRIIGKDGQLYQFVPPPPPDQVADWGNVDPAVGILLWQTADGGQRVVASNFACHPVTVQVQPLVSADFPGAAMDFVEQAIPGCAGSLFLQGACGDINPARADTRDFADVERYGLMLAGEIVKQTGRLSAPDVAASAPAVAVASETIQLPVRELPPVAPVMQAYQDATRRLRSHALAEEERRLWQGAQRMAEETLILIERGSTPIPAEIQVVRLGDAALVCVPGELFVDFGLAIKARSAAPHTFIVGYANDWIGYLATPQAWQQGGYEVGPGPWARVGPEGGQMVVDKALELVAGLWREGA